MFPDSQQDQAEPFVHRRAGRTSPCSSRIRRPSLHSAGRARPTRSARPARARRGRRFSTARRTSAILLNEKVGEIKATILERDGKILMVKDCPHPRPLRGRDGDGHRRSSSTSRRCSRAATSARTTTRSCTTTAAPPIKHGRGSVLTVDLTNRCNMMCDPCFMDAEPGRVRPRADVGGHQARCSTTRSRIKPRRQMSVQFSGGEPTMSPHFLDAVRYARKVGYNSVQAATNGIEFAKSPEFAKAAAEAGLRYAYLQFDGIGNAANSHRRVGNLFDVKLRAIENLHSAGVDIVPVVTIVNGVNNEQVGRIIEFALDNPKRINFLSFQPVSFTGRDEEITPERRAAQRYTLSHLAHDVKNQTGIGEPIRDWFPISFMATFTDWADVVHGPDREWGQLTCGCHPNCGIGMALMIDKETKEAVPVTAFLKAEQLARDVAQVNDAARGKFLSVVGMALALMRNYDSFKAPTHFRIADLLKKFDKTFGATGKNYGKVSGDRTMTRHREAARRPLELPVHRRHVVPGPLQLRLPPHRDVHHPVRDAAGRDLLLRLQHGHRLAEHHREDAHDGHAHQVVRRARPPRDLRRQQERAAHRQRPPRWC